MMEPLHNAGYDLIFIDFPGFGLSSGRDIQQRVWRKHGPEIVTGVLDAFGATSQVSVIGFCGGAATFMRTLVQYPTRFQGRNHVFHNSVTSEVPLELEQHLLEGKMDLLVTWNEDRDHLKISVGYKGLQRLRKENFPNLVLIDIGDDVLSAVDAPGMKM